MIVVWLALPTADVAFGVRAGSDVLFVAAIAGLITVGWELARRALHRRRRLAEAHVAAEGLAEATRGCGKGDWFDCGRGLIRRPGCSCCSSLTGAVRCSAPAIRV
jgi:hypothetical protein